MPRDFLTGKMSIFHLHYIEFICLMIPSKAYTTNTSDRPPAVDFMSNSSSSVASFGAYVAYYWDYFILSFSSLYCRVFFNTERRTLIALYYRLEQPFVHPCVQR